MRMTILLLLVAALGCSGGDPQNSALCGITMMASGNRVLDQMANSFAILSEPPVELQTGNIATRVLGHASSQSAAGLTEEGKVLLSYEGEGLPTEAGFGVALVDDSSEVFRGVLILGPEAPQFPELGTIVDATGASVPLFGLRIHWSSVNSEDCPIFAQ